MNFRNLMFLVCVGVLLGSVHAEALLDADIDNDSAYASWPTSATVTGGAWANAAAAEYDAEVNALVITNCEATLTFNLTASKALADGEYTVDQRVAFSPLCDLPEIPDGAKAGLCLFEDDDENLAWYGLAKDGATNAWVKLTAATAPTVDDVYMSTNDLRAVFSAAAGTNLVTYIVGGETLTYGDKTAIEIAIDSAAKLSSVAYGGSGAVLALTGESAYYVAQVDGVKYTSVSNAVEIAAEKDVKIDIIKEVTEGGVSYTKNEEVPLGGGEIVTTVAQTADTGKIKVNAGITLKGVPASYTKTYTVAMFDAKGAETNHLEVAGADSIEIPLEKEGDAGYNPTGLYRVKLVAQGAAKTLAVTSDVTIGVLKLQTAATKALIAVPWREIEGDGDVSIANLVKTANLTAGDKLYVYDRANSRYNCWSLGSDKIWQGLASYGIDENGQMSSTAGAAPATTTVARGSAVWLERQNTSNPIYFYGRHDTTTAATTTIESGTTAAPTYNLVAAPGLDDINLNAKFSSPNDGDQILLPTGGVPKRYTRKDGAWGYDAQESLGIAGLENVMMTVRKTDANIPAGTGFWYINTGSEKNVTW